MIFTEVRARIEAGEERLSPLAAKSRYTRGRLRPEPPCAERTAYQRDRDRVIHCKSFRRLKDKMQVFFAPQNDHYATRLTHTLEVAQIARTIARALNLNEDLTEAIGLGHDLGHAPFGHAGDDALSKVFTGGFRHNEQSLRVVDVLERDGKGLNLTWEVRDGILRHSKARDSICAEGWGVPRTLEGQIVKTADSIAYLSHDIVDAERAGVLTEGDLPVQARRKLGARHSERVNAMVCDVIESSWRAARADDDSVGQSEADVASLMDLVDEMSLSGRPVITMSPSMLDTVDELRDFMFRTVYRDCNARPELKKAQGVLAQLFAYFCQHPDLLPDELRRRVAEDGLERASCDHVSGMTDQYALRVFEQLNLSQLPQFWAGSACQSEG
jgi:dGTPase